MPNALPGSNVESDTPSNMESDLLSNMESDLSSTDSVANVNLPTLIRQLMGLRPTPTKLRSVHGSRRYVLEDRLSHLDRPSRMKRQSKPWHL